MKYLIVSDIHGSKESAEFIYSLEKEYNFSNILVLGDLNYNGARNDVPNDYSPKDVVNIFNLFKDKCIFIRGNCDSRVDELVLEKEFYDLIKLKIDNVKFTLTHGDLYNPTNYRIRRKEVFLYGHTHIYELTKNKNNSFTINPGSISMPKNNNDRTYIIYDSDKKEFSLYNIDNQLIDQISI